MSALIVSDWGVMEWERKSYLGPPEIESCFLLQPKSSSTRGAFAIQPSWFWCWSRKWGWEVHPFAISGVWKLPVTSYLSGVRCCNCVCVCVCVCLCVCVCVCVYLCVVRPIMVGFCSTGSWYYSGWWMSNLRTLT